MVNNNGYPLVKCHITMERCTMLLMGKLTISTGPFSIAMWLFTRGYSKQLEMGFIHDIKNMQKP